MSIDNAITHGYYKFDDIETEFIWHREDGPADNDKQWFFHDQNVTSKVEEWLHVRNIDDYKNMTEEDKLALTFFMRSL